MEYARQSLRFLSIHGSTDILGHICLPAFAAFSLSEVLRVGKRFPSSDGDLGKMNYFAARAVDASSGPNPGAPFWSTLFVAAVVAAAGVLSYRLWTADPSDLRIDRRVRYIPRSVLRSLPAVTAACAAWIVGYWFTLLASDVRSQPAHGVVWAIVVVAAFVGFACFAISISVFTAQRPQSAIPPRMRKIERPG
jgi:hypothetical protein